MYVTISKMAFPTTVHEFCKVLGLIRTSQLSYLCISEMASLSTEILACKVLIFYLNRHIFA